LGYRLNNLAGIIFGIFAGGLSFLGVIVIYTTFDPEIGYSDVEISVLLPFYAIIGIFWFLTIFFFKKVMRHYQKTTSPQQKALEKKQFLRVALPSAIIAGIMVALYNYFK